MKKQEADRRTILLLAAETGLDVRTVRRALDVGVDSLRAAVDRDKFREAAKKLGLRLQ